MLEPPARWKLLDLQVRGDERGSLVALEGGASLPFELARVYFIFGTRAGVSRGFHAHRTLRQVAIAVRGSCTMIVEDSAQREEFRLHRPDRGLLIEGLVWREMHDFSEDCILLVLADRHFDEADYIRSYADFRSAAGKLP